MARPLRVDYPGAFYHVISRGNNQEKLYIQSRDREKFLQYLGTAAERFSIVIHTYCLMDNHYHLLAETPDANLSLAMQWINVSYATYFNRKRKRSGHLFQGRFKAILIEADAYLKHLSRYIHLNPVKAKMVSRPADYRWSSYAAVIGKQIAPRFLETGRLLSVFGQTEKEARLRYRDFVELVDVDTLENPEKKATGGFMLGEADFIRWVKKTFLTGRNEHNEIPQLKRLKPKVSLDRVVQVAAREFGCSPETIIAKGRKHNKAREIAICIARDISGSSCRELGDYFGGVSGASITMMHKRVNEEHRRNRRLRERFDRIRREIFNV